MESPRLSVNSEHAACQGLRSTLNPISADWTAYGPQVGYSCRFSEVRYARNIMIPSVGQINNCLQLCHALFLKTVCSSSARNHPIRLLSGKVLDELDIDT